ncbi:MAG: ATP-dependent DNA helicase RecG [Elusimicrobia bacterium]|nr:ATP-dependent DNA helicase RecG [Elusimicrobiota bacterium]
MKDIRYLKGVGPKRAGILAKIGISRIDDLFFYFPRKWEDRKLIKTRIPPGFAFLEPSVVFRGKVVSIKDVYTSTNLRIFRAVLAAGDAEIEALWYKRHNPRYDVFAGIRKLVAPGAEIWITGRPDDPLFNTKISVEEFYSCADTEAQALHINRIVPVYPITEGISSKFMRKAISEAIAERGEAVPEILPMSLAAGRGLMTRQQALTAIHFPESYFELLEARKRFIYEELFLMCVAWAIKRKQTKRIRKGYSYEIRKNLLTPFKENLKFEFTLSQKRAINRIFSDMQAPSPMARLLEGEVGSGKTVVAMCALLLAVENGYQGAFMAPTEILAEQHFITFEKFLKNMNVKFALLTSRIRSEERINIIEKVSKGGIDILIGTHAVIQDEVEFRNLRMIVIDEQHRFGVRQRAALRQKGEQADLLIMTATPIPRTLFLALYGDLDLSVLNEMPPGRTPVKTIMAEEEYAFAQVLKEVSGGRQAYAVYPVIEEGDLKGLKSVKKEFERLKKIFKGFKLDMIHGQMPGKEKKRIMEDFANRKTDILVSTSVIEVGIDVPNATVMVVNNAEQFGLASLHQLRGRVGRGNIESKCFLVADLKTPEARQRIEVICSISSGFELSEKDIYMRGAGDILGMRQHGDMELKIADIFADASVLRLAIEDRNAILKTDPRLLKPEHSELRKKLFELYSEKWNIIDLS